MRIAMITLLLGASMLCFSQQPIHTDLPFEGKPKIKKMELLADSETERLCLIYDYSSARKLSYIDKNNNLLQQYHYLYSSSTGLTDKPPTKDSYQTLSGAISTTLSQTTLIKVHANTFLEEMMYNEYKEVGFVTTNLETGKVEYATIEAKEKSYPLFYFTHRNNLYVVYVEKKANTFLIHRKKPGQPVEKHTLKADFTPLYQSGFLNPKDHPHYFKFCMLHFMEGLEFASATPVISGNYTNFNHLSKNGNLILHKDEVMLLHLIKANSILKTSIDLNTLTLSLQAVELSNAVNTNHLRNGNGSIGDAELTAINDELGTAFFTQSKDYFITLKANKDKALLLLNNKNSLQVEHVYYFDRWGNGMAQDSVIRPIQPARYYAGIEITDTIGHDKFFRLLNADLAPVVVQLFEQSASELFMSVEVNDQRIKFGDVLSSAAWLLPVGGGSIGQIFVNSFAQSAVATSIEMATEAVNNKALFVMPVALNANDMTIKGIAPPPVQNDGFSGKIQEILKNFELKEVTLLAVDVIKTEKAVAIYDKKTGKSLVFML